MNIYVGNLSFRATDDGLRDLFAQFGEVTSAKIMMDKMSGRSKGFGFVDMPDDAAANAAIAELNDKEFMERNLKVNEARPRTEGDRPRKSFNRGGGGGGFNRGGGGGGGGYGGGGNRY
jgi:RNA recognition motif-containing protein